MHNLAVAQQVPPGAAPWEMSSQSNVRELLRKGELRVIQSEPKFSVRESSNKICKISMFNVSNQKEIKHMKWKEQL